MLKKLTLMAVSVAALLAFAAPAAHATGALITDSEGIALGVGSKIVATSENTKTVTVNGTLECKTVILNGTIQETGVTTVNGNGEGEAKGTVPANIHNGHCGIAGTADKVNILEVSISSLHLTRHGTPAETTGTASFKYTYNINGFVHCTFQGTNVPVKKTGASSINVSGNLVRVAPSSAFCPATGTINGDFSVTSGGGAVTIH